MPTTPETFTLFGWATGAMPDVELSLALYTTPAPDDDIPFLADFTEVVFAGYSRLPLAVDDQTIDESPGFVECKTELAVFNMQQAIEANATVLGFYVIATFVDGEQILVHFSPLRAPLLLSSISKPFGIVLAITDNAITL
jgi:hypothetical protein